MHAIREFYSRLKFPGPYTIHDLDFLQDVSANRFLSRIDQCVHGASSVIDLGCGSGFIVNFLARRYPTIKFTAVDFSDSIDYASGFAKDHGITNVKWIKHDILQLDLQEKFDTVICVGVLHHMPQVPSACQQIDHMLTDQGTLCLGVYNWIGQNLRHVMPVSWRNEILRADQEDAPFAQSWSHGSVTKMFSGYHLQSVHPSLANHLVDFCNLTNAGNGGLTIYHFKKSHERRQSCQLHS